MVAKQVMGASCHRDARLQKSHLELPQILFAAPVYISDERRDFYPFQDRRFQCRFDIGSVKAKYCNLNAFLRVLES